MRWLTQFWKPIDSEDRFVKISRERSERLEKEGPKPVIWTAIYTAELDDGKRFEFDWEATFESEDRMASAGNLLLGQKYGTYAQVFDGILYPPHRLRQVTWTVVDGKP